MAHEGRAIHHEAPDINTRRVLLLVGGFVGFVVVLAGALQVFYDRTTGSEALTVPLKRFPDPQLQPDPGRDYVMFRLAQEQQLKGVAWVDKTKGLVHVPIEDAMAIVAARGPAGYDPVEGTLPFPQPGQPPLDGAPRAVPQPWASPYGAAR